MASNKTLEDIYCFYVTRGKLELKECHYPFVYYVEAALFRSIFGWSLTVIESLLVLAFWFCNIFIERDFMEAYMSLVGMATTLGTLCKVGCIVVQFAFSGGSSLETSLYLGYNMSSVTAVMTLLIGMPIFLYMSLKVGTSRKQNYGCCTWTPFLLIFIYSFIMNWVYNFVTETIFTILLYFLITPMILSILLSFGLIGLALPAFTCCSGSRPTMDRLDPVIFDARSRLGWAIIFSIIMQLPSGAVLYCLVKLTFFINTKDVYEVFMNEELTRVWTFLFPILCLLLMFVILPSYRDKILCGCRKQRYVRPILTTAAATTIPKPPGPNNKKFDISQTMPVTIVPNLNEQRPYPVNINHILSPISVKH